MHFPFGPVPEAVAEPTASSDVLAAEPGDSDELLRAAIADSRRESGFLPIAEEAVQARPGDAHLLLLAAAAALLDRNPERALKFLKRFAKRFVLVNAYHLLGALALAQQNKLLLARSVLESHGLDNPSLSIFLAAGRAELGSIGSSTESSSAARRLAAGASCQRRNDMRRVARRAASRPCLDAASRRLRLTRR